MTLFLSLSYSIVSIHVNSFVCVHLCVEVSVEGPVDFAEVPFSEYQGGEFDSDDIEDALFEWCVYFSLIFLPSGYYSNAIETMGVCVFVCLRRLINVLTDICDI